MSQKEEISKNSFKKLEEELQHQYKDLTEIEENVIGQIRTVRSIGNFFDFFTIIFDVLIMILGGSKSSSTKKIVDNSNQGEIAESKIFKIVEIILERDFNTYTHGDLNVFLESIEEVVGVNNIQEIYLIENSSVKITIKMEETALIKLLKLFRKKKLKKLNIKEIIIEEDLPSSKVKLINRIDEKFERVKTNLRDKIGENKLKEAMNDLKKVIVKGEKNHNFVQNLLGQFTSVNSDFRMGLIEYKDYNIHMNSIRIAILELIDNLNHYEINSA